MNFPPVPVSQVDDYYTQKSIQVIVDWLKANVVSSASTTTSTTTGVSFQPGMMMFWVSTQAPDGWLLYTDSPINITDAPNLYAIFGTNFSQLGDDVKTFRLPPGLGRVPLISGSGSGLTARAFGDTGGEEKHSLTLAEIPHTSLAVQTGSDGTGLGGSVTAHNNMQPFVCWNAIIKL